MILLHLIRVVLMAGCTVVGGVAGTGMAGSARQCPFLAVIEREAMLAQLGREPRFGRMTVGAVGAKNAKVEIRFGVAGQAITGRTLELLIVVAGCAVRRGVSPGQRPDRGVVEWRHAVQTIVAGLAAGAKEGGVFLYEAGNGRFMAGLAGGICYLARFLLSMAAGTGHLAAIKINYMVRQAKVGAFMIKRHAIHGGGQPGSCCVAAGAVGAKQGKMLGGLGVASNARLRRLLEIAVSVAALALGNFVCPGQGKQLSVLRHCKVRQAVQPIVAVEAGRPVRFVVPRHKLCIQLTMAAGTTAICHAVVAWLHMAIGTNDVGAVAGQAVVVQGKAGDGVVKLGQSSGL